MNVAALSMLAEVVGFAASVALTIPAARLVTDQKSVASLRAAATDAASSGYRRRAEAAAGRIERWLSRFDRVDEILILVGVVGLGVSFALRLATFVVP
jgi:hypothetical protein